MRVLIWLLKTNVNFQWWNTNRMFKKEIARRRCTNARTKVESSEIAGLREQLTLTKFLLDRFKHNETHFKFYTGFKTYEMCKIFYTFLQPEANAIIYWGSVKNIDFTIEQSKYGRSRSLQPQEKLFLTLVQLCCGFQIEDLSVRFNISTSTISRIIITWIDFLYSRLEPLPIWSQRKTIDEFMPKALKELYPSTRCIVDCTEIFIEMPTSHRSQSATFSNYKHHNTAKGFIGISPSGSVTFVSELYTCRCNDKNITNDCGI